MLETINSQRVSHNVTTHVSVPSTNKRRQAAHVVYDVTLNVHGIAIHCTCPARTTYYPDVPCSHMKTWNDEEQNPYVSIKREGSYVTQRWRQLTDEEQQECKRALHHILFDSTCMEHPELIGI